MARQTVIFYSSLTHIKVHMTKIICAIFCSLFLVGTALASEGLVSISSPHTVKATADRFERIIKKKGLTLFARVDHTKNAATVNLKLNPTEVIIFGNPKVGTPLMHCAQRVAIDLPQKALFWQDDQGQVWLSYNDPAYLAERHDIKGCQKIIKKITHVLSKLSRAAVSK